MASPSSSSSVASQQNGVSQSTKERRRERNRLAAQKHRMRRSQRMSELEEQVLALQQEKHALLSKSYPQDSPESDDERTQVKRARTAPRVGLVTVANAGDDDKDYISRLEDRIIELERWTEEINGALHDSLDSEASLKAQLQCIRSARRGDDLHHSQPSLAEYRASNAKLKDALDHCQATLELQRRENQSLKERIRDLHTSSNGTSFGSDKRGGREWNRVDDQRTSGGWSPDKNPHRSPVVGPAQRIGSAIPLRDSPNTNAEESDEGSLRTPENVDDTTTRLQAAEEESKTLRRQSRILMDDNRRKEAGWHPKSTAHKRHIEGRSIKTFSCLPPGISC